MMPNMPDFYSQPIAFPTGIERAVLWLFSFLLVLNLYNLIRVNKKDLMVPVMIHGLGGILNVLSSNLFVMLISWEVLGFSAFYLLWSNPNSNGRRTASRYLVFQLISALCFFTALVFHFRETGSWVVQTLVPEAQFPFLFAVMIKTASLPTHLWLSDAYPLALMEIAPFLTGFTTKVGVLTALRLVNPLIWDLPLLGYIGSLTAVFGVLFALQQTNGRKLLSYHIISQVGYMTAAIGFASGDAALFHLITHTLYKSLLFFVAIEAANSFGHENLKQMGGLAKERPWLAVIGILGAAAISGVPFTSGYASKEVISHALNGTLAYSLLRIASIGTGISFLKFIYLIFFRRTSVNPGPKRKFPFHVPLLLLSLVTLVIGFIPGTFLDLPSTYFWNLGAFSRATQTLGLSIIGWLLLRGVLLTSKKAEKKENRIITASVDLLSRIVQTMSDLLNEIHKRGPKFQLFMMISTFIILVWVGAYLI